MTAPTQPKIRDFTRPAQGLTVDVASHPATDLLLTLMAFSWEDLTDYDLGQDWFDGMNARMSAGTRRAIEATTRNRSKIWFGFFHLVADGPEGETVDEFLDRLESIDASEIRKGMVESLVDHHQIESGTIEDAVAGDGDAIEAVVACCGEMAEMGDDLEALLTRNSDDAKADLIRALRGFHEEAFRPIEAQYAGALERDARAKKAMVAIMSPERVIEEATNGITVEPGTGVRSVLLVPTVVLRPWVLILEHRATRIFVYPVSDEHMTTDPDWPSPWIVKTYKALADEKRVRVLRRLAAGPAGFQELVDYLDAAKSTVHHHLRVLRSARLVRVTLGAEKEYSLRQGVIAEAAKALQEFVEAGASKGEDS